MSNEKRVQGQNIKLDVTHKHLMRQIAQSSGYHLYEVEDVMLHFVAALQTNMRKKKATGLHGLGKFLVIDKNIPERYSKIVGRTLPARVEQRLIFKAADEFKRAARNEV